MVINIFENRVLFEFNKYAVNIVPRRRIWLNQNYILILTFE